MTLYKTTYPYGCILLRGLSNLVLSLIMLSIALPIGYIILDRVRSASSEIHIPSIPPMVVAYSIKNGSGYALIIFNLGPGRAIIDGIVDTNVTYHEEYLVVEEGAVSIIIISYQPQLIVLRGGETVKIKPLL
ncbi:MAG: hypothetical protein QXE01_06600 [Sulfolobales archaeon]